MSMISKLSFLAYQERKCNNFIVDCSMIKQFLLQKLNMVYVPDHFYEIDRNNNNYKK